jgi:hypothetical protein
MKRLFPLILIGFLAGCGDDDPSRAVADLPTIAETSDIHFDGAEMGVTPFIYRVRLAGVRVPAIKTVSYTIEPKAGTVSKPVHVSYSMSHLKARGNLESGSLLQLPVFGLYAGSVNQVSIRMSFSDGSAQDLAVSLTTDAFVDPTGIYTNPMFVQRRAAGSALGFDFFLLKPVNGSPVVVDTDGEVRWVTEGVPNAFSTLFTENGFIIGAIDSTEILRAELDGTVTPGQLATTNYSQFHHNIDPGRDGYLGEFDTPSDIESQLAEFNAAGEILKEWKFEDLISSHMQAGGDDPTLFVRRGVDWFHSNAATYDRRDDSLIASSRENFLIKVDYDTGEIIWIFGDPTKYWATFPSLQSKALTLAGGGLYPIGQHSVSVTSDGLLMVFNNGFQSVQQPTGAPAGAFRPYSTVSAYRIDPATMTATEEWSFDYGQSISSIICSSAYEADEKSVLVNYSFVDGGARSRLVGLNAAHEVVFDIQYDSLGSCGTSWNATPIPFHEMSFQ